MPDEVTRRFRNWAVLIAAMSAVFLFAVIIGFFAASKFFGVGSSRAAKSSAPSLLVHLPLTEDFRDTSPNQVETTVKGTITISDGAAHFSGKSGFIELPHVPIEDRPFTISLWVKPAAGHPHLGLVSERADPSTGKFLHVILNDTGLHFGFYGDDLRVAAGVSARDAWIHYLFQFDGTNKQIYADGKLIGHGISKPFKGRSGPMHIGDAVPWNDVTTFRGDMRDFRVYSGTLSETDVQKLFADAPVAPAPKVASFSEPSSASTNRTEVWTGPGSVDETFHRVEILGQELRSVAVQRDGKIILSGYFDKADGDWHNSIVRLNADGTVDTSFKTKAGGSVHTIAIQPDGKIVLAGDFRNVNGSAHRTVARLNPDGTLDESFNTGRGGDKEAYCLAIQRDGKILVGGSFASFDGSPRQRFVRLNANGKVDSTFNARADQGPSRMIAQPDGNILASGSFAKPTGPRYGFTRVRPDGLPDRSFKPPWLDDCKAMALLSDGKILVGKKAGPVLRLNVDGSVDSTFVSGLTGEQTIAALLVDSRGRIIVVGEFAFSAGDFQTRCVARLNSNGSLDRTFHCPRGFRSPIVCAAVTPNDDTIIAGNFAARVLRLRGDGR